MAIPKYNELYRLVLLSLQDGGMHSMKEVRDFIISTLHLTGQDLAETLPTCSRFGSKTLSTPSFSPR